MRALSLQKPRFISKSIHAASQEVVHTAAMALQTMLFFSNPNDYFLLYNGFPWWAAIKSCKDLRAFKTGTP